MIDDLRKYHSLLTVPGLSAVNPNWVGIRHLKNLSREALGNIGTNGYTIEKISAI